ncbi:hypothetical protein LMG29542_08357 [Paraburkholderia humisilvae]|uniref:Uncharacterized protein n=1 Tax=Paraburkholderia humisilvae TaxID=627669 RepID=A0A6J5FCM3_9BURK|nr:hypothetical protein LMG29542_08357 [Paraburkholderia humisilvae]
MPVVSDAGEACGQHIDQDAAFEFAGFEGHGLVAGAPLRTMVLGAMLVDRTQR